MTFSKYLISLSRFTIKLIIGKNKPKIKQPYQNVIQLIAQNYFTSLKPKPSHSTKTLQAMNKTENKDCNK